MGSNNKDVLNLGEALKNASKDDLVNLLTDKLNDLALNPSDFLEKLSPVVRKRVDVLREIQKEHDEFKAKFLEERAVLEAKYQKQYQPLYSKRYDIVNGVTEVEGTTTAAEATNDKGVPDFWLNALKNNEVLTEEITERDEAALRFLKDIKWSRVENPKGFKLEFHFDTNPFFKNSVLTKSYHMIDEDEPILEKATGTEIEWHPGKSLTQKILKKKSKKSTKNAKPITKTEECESFFKFFDPPQVPEDADIDEDDAEELQALLENDYDIGTTIRDKIIPHAVSWFTGEAADDEYGSIEDDDDLDEDDDEDEDEEDDEDDDDDEDEEADSETKKKKGGKVAGGEQGEKPAECQQQ